MEYNIINMQISKSIFTEGHKIIIKKLKQARFEIDLDQKQVAQKLGKTQSYVSKIESGQRRIDVIQLKSFAKIYKKDLEYFID
jgi:transcriptional regulator with XRE-family HTH domain